MDSTERDKLARERLAGAVVDKTWTVPAYEGMGPVTMTLRLPEVRITDSEGRYIIISPRQTDLVSSRMAGLHEWLCYGDGDWLPDNPDNPDDLR